VSPTEISAQEKIILAAIDCIEEEGIQDVTIRSIANKAGVNSAAINYYFRSKDNLMAMVLENTAKHFVSDLLEYLNAEDQDMKQQIRNMFNYILDGAIRYPRISLANAYDTLVEKREDTPFARHIRSLLESMLAAFKAYKPDAKPAELAFLIVRLVSAVMLPSLTPEMFNGFAGLDFRDEHTRRRYVESIVVQL
jgi:AcrR family transcriptional regulator